MKLAITMIPDTGRISPVFETSEHLRVVRLCRSGSYTVIAEHTLPESETEKITFLRQCEAGTLICGAISNEILEKVRSIGVRVLPFVSGSWDAVIRAAFEKTCCLPPDYIMPGCCGHHRKCCQNQGKRENENCIDNSGRNS